MKSITRNGDSKSADGWQYWKDAEYYQSELRRRAEGALPEMQCAKQITRLVAETHRAGESILDAGCGAGHYLNSLGRDLEGSFSYHGIDITPQHIEAARAVYRSQGNADFEVADVRTLPFADETFATTICANTIPHIPNAAQALRELFRVTGKTLFVRLLIGNEILITKKAASEEMDERGEPVTFSYVNIYTESFVRSALGASNVKVEFLEDQFDSSELESHFLRHQPVAGIQRATRVVGGLQFKNYLALPWKILKATRLGGREKISGK
jgi:SAM-dependent methyltransferase